MFAESLLESGVVRRSDRRGWTTLLSVTLQLTAVAVLAILPSLYPEVMSMRRPALESVPVFSRAPQAEVQPIHNNAGPSVVSVTPVISVPDSTMIYGPARKNIDPGIPGAPNLNLAPTGPGFNAVPIGSAPPVIKGPMTAPTKPLVISHMDEGQLLRKVQPPYPVIAKTAGIQGPVTLAAIISKTGEIESLRVISGHPMLAAAARDAVSKWRYRPYILNGEPIEVETQITVNFKLGN